MIVLQILEVCTEGAGKTRIVYQSNLNFSTVNPYLDLLVSCGLLERGPGPRAVYRTTTRGLEIMKGFKHHQTGISKLDECLENALM